MIYFFREEYAWLSNYAECKIDIKGIIYDSVEHAYLSCKLPDDEWKILCTRNSPRVIKQELTKRLIRPDWDDIKIDAMRYCLNEKFRQEPFRTKLIETGNQNIVEGNYWGDTFWGVDLKQDPNIGENNLGRLIMSIRDNINK